MTFFGHSVLLVLNYFSAPFSPYLTTPAAPLAILFSCACHVLCVCCMSAFVCVDTA